MMISWNALATAQLWWATSMKDPIEPQTTRDLKMCSVTDSEWSEMINDALDSYSSMDIEEFGERRAEVHEHAFCLSSVVTFRTVGSFHKMEVLYSFMDKDKASFAAHVRAAELADPSAPLSTS